MLKIYWIKAPMSKVQWSNCWSFRKIEITDRAVKKRFDLMEFRLKSHPPSISRCDASLPPCSSNPILHNFNDSEFCEFPLQNTMPLDWTYPKAHSHFICTHEEHSPWRLICHSNRQISKDSVSPLFPFSKRQNQLLLILWEWIKISLWNAFKKGFCLLHVLR